MADLIRSGIFLTFCLFWMVGFLTNRTKKPLIPIWAAIASAFLGVGQLAHWFAKGRYNETLLRFSEYMGNIGALCVILVAVIAIRTWSQYGK